MSALSDGDVRFSDGVRSEDETGSLPIYPRSMHKAIIILAHCPFQVRGDGQQKQQGGTAYAGGQSYRRGELGCQPSRPRKKPQG